MMRAHSPQPSPCMVATRAVSRAVSPSPTGLASRGAQYPMRVQGYTPRVVTKALPESRVTQRAVSPPVSTDKATGRRTLPKRRPSNPGLACNYLRTETASDTPSVCIGGSHFRILEALGKGSFGEVRRGTSERHGEVAIKEIICKSSGDLQRASFEANILQSLNYANDTLKRLPALVASDVDTSTPGVRKVRLAMTRVPGQPLEEFIGERRKLWACWNPRLQCEKACRYAGQLIVQLAPTLENVASRVYHRDVTPRNIQIDCQNSTRSEPFFGLVDFGLAVDAVKWRVDDLSSDLAGDGHYWPTSAWYVFGHGTRALEAQAGLRHEYRTCLDVHALGISALRCLVELIPALHEEDGQDAALDHFDEAAREGFMQLRALHKAWAKYWADARRFWQPVFNAFRNVGSFKTIKASYVETGVHHTVSSNLCNLRTIMAKARKVCMWASDDSGLRGLPPLFDALLLMIQPGYEDGEALPYELSDHSVVDVHENEQNVTTAVSSDGSSYRRGRSRERRAWEKPRATSPSTGTPDSSPSCASSVPSGCHPDGSIVLSKSSRPLGHEQASFVNLADHTMSRQRSCANLELLLDVPDRRSLQTLDTR